MTPVAVLSYKYKTLNWRWDKSDLGLYYNEPRNRLSSVSFPSSLCFCKSACNDASHCDIIDRYYNSIVQALYDAASDTVVHIPCHALKPFWNEHLDS